MKNSLGRLGTGERRWSHRRSMSPTWNRLLRTDLQQGVDFLLEQRQVDNIMTNPPFGLADRFYRHALRLAQRKVVMLGQLNALAGLNRYESVYRLRPLARVYVFVKPPSIRGNEGVASQLLLAGLGPKSPGTNRASPHLRAQ